MDQRRVAVVTGGSKGLGKCLAFELVKAGYQVVICARNNTELQSASPETRFSSFIADVSKEEDMRALAKFAITKFGRIDVWVNNAGAWIPPIVIENLDIGKVREIFEPNVFGLMCGSKTALIQMRKQGYGMIVNIISTSGLTGRPMLSGYAASKWAARGFTESLREECMGSTTIRIIAVYPGGMKTGMFNAKSPEDIEDYMEPESVAKKVVSNLERKEPEYDLIIKRPLRDVKGGD